MRRGTLRQVEEGALWDPSDACAKAISGLTLAPTRTRKCHCIPGRLHLAMKAKKGDAKGTRHTNGDYADCVAQGSPNSIIIEKGERERMKSVDKGLSGRLQTETGNEG